MFSKRTHPKLVARGSDSNDSELKFKGAPADDCDPYAIQNYIDRLAAEVYDTTHHGTRELPNKNLDEWELMKEKARSVPFQDVTLSIALKNGLMDEVKKENVNKTFESDNILILMKVRDEFLQEHPDPKTFEYQWQIWVEWERYLKQVGITIPQWGKIARKLIRLGVQRIQEDMSKKYMQISAANAKRKTEEDNPEPMPERTRRKTDPPIPAFLYAAPEAPQFSVGNNPGTNPFAATPFVTLSSPLGAPSFSSPQAQPVFGESLFSMLSSLGPTGNLSFLGSPAEPLSPLTSLPSRPPSSNYSSSLGDNMMLSTPPYESPFLLSSDMHIQDAQQQQQQHTQQQIQQPGMPSVGGLHFPFSSPPLHSASSSPYAPLGLVSSLSLSPRGHLSTPSYAPLSILQQQQQIQQIQQFQQFQQQQQQHQFQQQQSLQHAHQPSPTYSPLTVSSMQTAHSSPSLSYHPLTVSPPHSQAPSPLCLSPALSPAPSNATLLSPTAYLFGGRHGEEFAPLN